jgi:hypothetical protein
VSLSVFLLLLLPLLIISGRGSSRSDSANVIYSAAVLKSYPPKTIVLALSPSIGDAFPAVLQDHLVWASRFPCLWMLPAIIQNEMAEHGGPVPRKVVPPGTVAKLAAMQRKETAADLQKWKPNVVVVRNCTKDSPCYALEGIMFDPIAWFLRSPDFAAEWSHYRVQIRHGDYDVYARTR